MLSALHRKLWRDLIRLRGQVVTIALVIAAGIASFVTMRGNYTSLEAARDRFYDQQRFGDVFVQLERAPESVRAEIAALPGIAHAESRIVKPAMLPLAQLDEPVRGLVVSLSPLPQLNLPYLREGRLPEPAHADEAVLLQGFADAHRIQLGDRIPVVINGKKRLIQIVGLAASPEYVMAMAAGSLSSDPERFAVLWLGHAALAAAFNMQGAFNDLTLELRPGTSVAATIDAIDPRLSPYGGLGAYARDRQRSHYMLSGELQQRSSMAVVLPSIFLAVALLLVNLVLSRLVHIQQAEIATLKALGYGNRQVGLYFLELVLVVSSAGSLLGLLIGQQLGSGMLDLYARYFKFPDLRLQIDAHDAALAVLGSFFAAATGALSSVRRAASIPPAEAMRPSAPTHYRSSIVDRLGLRRFISPSAHMIVRELERRPLRTLMSCLALAAATALTVVGGYYADGIEALLYSQFHQRMREDAAVTFIRPQPERVLRELASLPAVLSVEGLRTVPVRFRVGHRRRRQVDAAEHPGRARCAKRGSCDVPRARAWQRR
jgi:putative ABC transport system permease protein